MVNVCTSLQCRRFHQARANGFNVETPEERRKWGESPTVRVAISTLPNLPLS